MFQNASFQINYCIQLAHCYEKEYAGWTMAPKRTEKRASAVCVHSDAIASEFSSGASSIDYATVAPAEFENSMFNQTRNTESVCAVCTRDDVEHPDEIEQDFWNRLEMQNVSEAGFLRRLIDSSVDPRA